MVMVYSKTCVKLPLSKRPKLVFKTNYRLMHSAILSTFIKLPFVSKIFALSIFVWPFYTGFTVHRLLPHYDFAAHKIFKIVALFVYFILYIPVFQLKQY